MCKVICERVEEGLIPSEKVAHIATIDGSHEEVVVSAKQVEGIRLCAAEVGRDGDKVLVELPRESSSGRWRIWVAEAQLRA